MANIEQQIADTIKQAMGREISVNELHQKTGIPYNTLKRRVTDGRGLEVYELEAIAKALNLEPEELLTGQVGDEQAA